MMISYQQALDCLVEEVQRAPKPIVTVPLLQALGKTAASNLTSSMDVPSFRNSAMDGFAVRSSALATATAHHPIACPIIGTQAAGDTSLSIDNLATKGALKIMTGAPIPESSEPFDAIIPIENITVHEGYAFFTKPAKPNENIRLPGEDVQKGQTLLTAGSPLTPEAIMLLAAVGINSVPIYRPPELYLVSTGKEIVDIASTPLPSGKIYNSNAPYLLACAQEAGLTAHYAGVIGDDPAAFRQALQKAPSNAIVMSTGAVSKGDWDFIPETLAQLGATIHFHRVNIRPGKPILFACLAQGAYFFGLPGNPISTAIGFHFFVMPCLQLLQGQPLAKPLLARLCQDFTKKGNFRQFLKAHLRSESTGTLSVDLAVGQESFKIHSMATSNAWAILEEGRTEYQAGEVVQVIPYASQSLF